MEGGGAGGKDQRGKRSGLRLMTTGKNWGRDPSSALSFIHSILSSAAPIWSLATEDTRHVS